MKNIAKITFVALALLAGVSMNAQEAVNPMVAQFTTMLGLDDAQVSQVEAIYAATADQESAIKERMLANRERRSTGTRSAEEHTARRAELNEVLSDRKALMTEREEAITEVLTDDQKTIFAKYKDGSMKKQRPAQPTLTPSK